MSRVERFVSGLVAKLRPKTSRPPADPFDYSPEDYKTFEPFPVDSVHNARCISVYDGDTYHMGIVFDEEPVELKIRLDGLNCPEINKAGTAHELALAYMARDRARQYLTEDSRLVLTVTGRDYYGRVLARVQRADDGTDLTDALLRDKLAMEYGGEHGLTKLSWTDWPFPSCFDEEEIDEYVGLADEAWNKREKRRAKRGATKQGENEDE